MGQRKKGLTVQSVKRATEILQAFEDQAPVLGITELARKVGLNKSTTYGLVSTLEQCGFLEQVSGSGKYRLGLRLFELGNLVLQRLELKTVAAPFLRELTEKAGETVHLTIRDRADTVYIDKVECAHSVRLWSWVGLRKPLHSSASGKVLISEMDPEARRSLLGDQLPQRTARTICDWGELEMHLERVRQLGYATDDEENEEGVRCVAAPIRNHEGKIVGAVSVSGPVPRVRQEDFPRLAEQVKDTAANISIGLGYGGAAWSGKNVGPRTATGENG